ncbi:MAG: DUF4339 domain-containing protein, partial [Deltaproteobacteria bacterium]|nr:DUF4339 domain-containing protein [Deltaproteobacteria bacterium]
MKLICEQCGARYSIADDKVRGKVFKIRCKKCDNVIVVKGDADGGGALGIGAASLGEMAQASPGEMSPERSPYEHMAAGQEPSSWQGGMEGRGATPPPAEPPYAAAIPVWYVLIGQQQLGPLTQEQLGGYITSGEASAESYVWREGFTDWVQLHMLEEFAAYLQAAPAPGDPYLQHPGQAMGEDAGGQDGYGYHEAGKASPGAVPQD